MNQKRPDKIFHKGAFRRACGFLSPFRSYIATSIFCALFVGLAFTGGMGTMLPIMRVLIADEGVDHWVNRQIVESRLGVRLSEDDSHVLRVLSSDSPLAKDQSIVVESNSIADSVRILADPQTKSVQIGGRQINLEPVRFFYRWGQWIAGQMPSSRLGQICCVLAFLMIVSILGNIARFYQEHFSDRAAIGSVNNIRRQLYDHVLHTPLAYFGHRGTSDVTSRLVQDCNGLQEGFKTVLGQSIQEPIKAAMVFALAMKISWKLTLFIILFSPIMYLIIRKFGKKMRRAAKASLQKSSSMLGQIESSLTGIRVVKSANAERLERRKYTRIMDGLMHEQVRMSRLDALSAPVMETLTMLVVSIIVLYAAKLVLVDQALESEKFFLVMICLVGIGESLRRVSKVSNVLNRSSAAAARIFEMLDSPVERPRSLAQSNGQFVRNVARPRVKFEGIQREVVFENISFSYLNTSQRALANVNLSVQRGQSVAIVGRNGSGKTTLLALLPRFYDPDSGRVLIDGTDVRDFTLKSLRNQIGIVTQDSVIFPGTIAENIAYGMPLTPHDKIEEAARKAFAHDFILQKPQGYDTLLDGLGGQLSGGQKQRLNIARAILRQAPILILDEATSQVDAESEHLIQQAIESLMHERTTFVIAHRFSTIQSADRIIVMEQGQIVATGKHDELLNTCEIYRQLNDRQRGA